MKIGFIGCGNVGGKLSYSLLRNGFDLVVRDLDINTAQSLLDEGATWAESPKQVAESCEVIITCLPAPAACTLPRPSLTPVCVLCPMLLQNVQRRNQVLRR